MNSNFEYDAIFCYFGSSFHKFKLTEFDESTLNPIIKHQKWEQSPLRITSTNLNNFNVTRNELKSAATVVLFITRTLDWYNLKKTADFARFLQRPLVLVYLEKCPCEKYRLKYMMKDFPTIKMSKSKFMMDMKIADLERTICSLVRKNVAPHAISFPGIEKQSKGVAIPPLRYLPTPDNLLRIDEIVGSLKSGFQSHRICVLRGSNGSGKTYISTSFAFKEMENDSDGFNVYQMNGDSHESLMSCYRAYCVWLLGPGRVPDDFSNLQSVKDLSSYMINAEFSPFRVAHLIIIEDVDVVSDTFLNVLNSPILSNSKVLITVPKSLYDLDGIPANFVDISYSDENCVDFVRSFTSLKEISTTNCLELANFTDRNPRRFTAAVAYLNEFSSQYFERKFIAMVEMKRSQPEMENLELIFLLRQLKTQSYFAFLILRICAISKSSVIILEVLFQVIRERAMKPDMLAPRKLKVKQQDFVEAVALLIRLKLFQLTDVHGTVRISSYLKVALKEKQFNVKEIPECSGIAEINDKQRNYVVSIYYDTVHNINNTAALLGQFVREEIRVLDFKRDIDWLRRYCSSYTYLKEVVSLLRYNLPIFVLYAKDQTIEDESATELAHALDSNVPLTCLDLARINRPTFNFKRRKEIETEPISRFAQEIGFALARNKLLISLSLTESPIGSEGAMAFASGLKSNKTLEELNLNGSKIGDQSPSFVDFLIVNNTLKELHLNETDIGEETGMAIALVLKYNHGLTHLSLNKNKISSKGGVEIGKSLDINDTLLNLQLSGNELGDNVTVEFGISLKTNKSVQILNLSHNKIGSIGAFEIGDMLTINRFLTELNLSNNELGDEGAKHLASGIKENRTLLVLDISRNKIGTVGVNSIAKSLKINGALRELNLKDNEINSEAALLLKTALFENRTLKTLHLNGNPIESQTARGLAQKEYGIQSGLKINLDIPVVLEYADHFGGNSNCGSNCGGTAGCSGCAATCT